MSDSEISAEKNPKKELPEQTGEILLKAIPQGEPKLDRDFEFVDTKLRELKEGEVLVKTLYMSVDPYMRGKMRGIKTYTNPFYVGQPIYGRGIARVIQSENKQYQKDDLVNGMFNWADYTIVPPSSPDIFILGKLATDEDLEGSLTAWGSTGLTAYIGLLHIGQLKAGSVVLVSGAAGATGSFVGQIAKIKGCKVIGIAGRQDKLDFLKGLGFDEAVNYKSPTYEADLRKACEGGIDLYYDNVGGHTLDLAYGLCNPHATIVCCGAISTYNSVEPPQGPRHEWQIISKKLTVRGFIWSEHKEVIPQAIADMKRWVKEGKLKYNVTLRKGLKNIPSAFIEMLGGENVGKMLVKLE